MTNEQNIALVKKLRDAERSGDMGAARRISEAIVNGNEGLSRRLAMRFAKPESEADKEDAMQAARMGILRALKDFDPERGSFSTHAGNHIRDYVQRWTGRAASVGRPRSANMPADIARLAAKFRMSRGREPTAVELGVTEEHLTEWSLGTHFTEIDDSSSDEERPGVQLSGDAQEGEHVGERLDLRAAWADAVHDLSPRNQEIAAAFFIDGLSVRAISEEFGLCHRTATKLLGRVEARLRRAVDDAPESPSAKMCAVIAQCAVFVRGAS